MGASGKVTRRTGALRAWGTVSATTAQISAARPPWGWPRSATTSRPVLATEVGDGFPVQGRGATRVEHLAVDAFPGQGLGGAQAFAHHLGHGDNGDIGARAPDHGLAEGDLVRLGRHRAHVVVQPPVFDKKHRVAVVDGLQKQPLDVVGRGRQHDAQTRDRQEHAVQGLGVLGPRAPAPGHDGPDDERDVDLPVGQGSATWPRG